MSFKDDMDDDADPQVVDPRATSVDMPQAVTFANGDPIKFIRMTKLICSNCKGATGGSRMGIIKELGAGGITLQCEHPGCSSTQHSLESLLPK